MATRVATAAAAELPAMQHPRTTLLELLESKQNAQAMAKVATDYLPAERMAQLCVQAVRKTPKLALCDPSSVLGAMMMLGALGLEPNTILGHAYLIPYERKEWNPTTRKREPAGYDCNVIIGYKGFVQLVYRTPRVVKFTGSAICAADSFEYEEGSNSFLRHRISLERDRGPLIGAFAYAKIRGEHGDDADFSCVLPLPEIHRRRAMSDTYKYLVADVANAQNDKDRRTAEWKLAQTPWVLWENDMAAKSALRAMVKLLPVGGPLQVAAHADEATDTGRAHWAALADPDAARAFAAGETVGSLADLRGEDGEAPGDEPQKKTATKPTPAESKPAAAATAAPAAKAPPADAAAEEKSRGPRPPLFGEEA